MTAESASPDRTVVVVGAGHGGVQVVQSLRQGGWSGGIVLLEADTELPYERPPLSKDFLAAAADAPPALLRKASYYADKGIDLRLGDPAARIDRDARRVLTRDGRAIAYDKLVLAPGAQARPFAVPGAGLAGVTTLRTLAEARAVKGMLEAGRRIVIIGAGYIGLEVAAAACKAGAQVTVIEAGDRVMGRVACEIVSRHFQALHAAHGVRFRFATAVTELRGTGRVEAVVAAAGEVLGADGVVVGIGVVPNTRIAAEAGLPCADGILVDGLGRTADPDIYAVGDATRIATRHGATMRLECIQNAVDQANAVARHILTGEEAEPQVPWFWTVQHGVRLQSAGVRAEDDEALVRPSAKGDGFSVLHLRAGALAAIDTVDCLQDFMPARRLIASRRPIDRAAAVDPAVKLTQLLA